MSETPTTPAKPQARGITRIGVKNFKSIQDASIEIRPLTVLAGANSSGKSSIMQPLLLLKQTLEAPNFQGVLLLDGANVSFSSVNDFLPKDKDTSEFSFLIEVGSDTCVIKLRQQKGLQVVENLYTLGDRIIRLNVNMNHEELVSILQGFAPEAQPLNTGWKIRINKVFLDIESEENTLINAVAPSNIFRRFLVNASFIHVKGIRGKPQRVFPSDPDITYNFDGNFEDYVPSLMRLWYETKSTPLTKLGTQMQALGLTNRVVSRGDHVRVGRTLNSDVGDWINLADVGLGVSQVLPVLVALLVAPPGQLVYIEQPELHLHPRAQHKLAEFIAEAAARGVRVVIETHSDLLLLGIQTAVVEKKIAPEDVILHWFKRGEDGITTIKSATLDENGAYGDWDEDFAETDLHAQSRYLDAVGAREFGA